MNVCRQAETHEKQAETQGDPVGQVDTAENVSDVPEPGYSLFALCGLGVIAIATLGWLCALAWVTWRLGGWLLS